ncbi:MAG: hypothetical protein O6761_01620 [Thaumarchaeota archaeon]|nr:hypothetical protein [Nitrososphaerota archaeon]
MTKEEHEKLDINSTLKNIQTLMNESIQVFELDKEKDNVIDDLYNSLKILSSHLGFSVEINPELLNMPPDTIILLTPMLDLMIKNSNNKFEQKRIDEFSLDEITNIIDYVFTKLTELALADKESMNKKITYLSESVKKLRELQTVDGKAKVSEPAVQLEDLK